MPERKSRLPRSLSSLPFKNMCIKGLFCFTKAIKLGADGWADLMWHMSLVALKERQ